MGELLCYKECVKLIMGTHSSIHIMPIALDILTAIRLVCMLLHDMFDCTCKIGFKRLNWVTL